MGPVSAKSYPARRVSRKGERPHLAPDYGRRGNVWVYGGLQPCTGRVFTQVESARDTRSFVAFLDALMTQWPEGRLVLILDNLSTHRTMDVRLWALAHERVSFLFQPVYAPWLNLIEPWWKTLRTLALKGRCFDSATDVTHAIQAGTNYWNAHRHPYTWRKSYA